jgi:hypothetical protein
LQECNLSRITDAGAAIKRPARAPGRAG